LEKKKENNMKKFWILMVILLAPFNVFGTSDFAGQGKAPITWDELMKPKIDPSRYFATPGGGHGDHPAGGYSAPSVAKAKADQPAAPTVKPDESKDPNPPHIPMVKPPKPQPEVKPEPKLEPEVKPDCKPETHKCWSFKFRPVKFHAPKVKHDKKPSGIKGVNHKKNESAKSDHKGPGPSNLGKDSSCGKFGGQKGDKGPGVGRRGIGHHGVGKGRR
jgi:hypothetical protein